MYNIHTKSVYNTLAAYMSVHWYRVPSPVYYSKSYGQMCTFNKMVWEKIILIYNQFSNDSDEINIMHRDTHTNYIGSI